jgi:hypothetical protein
MSSSPLPSTHVEFWVTHHTGQALETTATPLPLTRECSYCGTAASSYANCVNCGAPALLTDKIHTTAVLAHGDTLVIHTETDVAEGTFAGVPADALEGPR